MLRRTLSLPELLIQRRTDRRGIKLEAVVVLFYGLLGTAGFAYFSYEVWNTLEAFAKPAYLNYTLVGVAFEPTGFLLITWVGYGVLGHFVGKMYNGRGPIIRILRTSTWALTPIAVWYVIRSIVVSALVFTSDLESNPQIEAVGPQAMADHYLEVVLETPIYVATMLIGLLFVFWSWRLLSVALEEAKSLSEENARKVAAVPAGILALYLLRLTLKWQTFF